jgi:hypothetical protein
MADFSLQLQADNLPKEAISTLLVEGPWQPIMKRLLTAENLLLEGCRGVGKTMLMRAASQRLQQSYLDGGRTLGVHTTFKRYLATLPPPAGLSDSNSDLSNFRAWINARILHAVQTTVREIKPEKLSELGELGLIDWNAVVSVLETTYQGRFEHGILATSIGLPAHVIASLQGYSYASDLLKRVRDVLGLDLLILFLDDAAHALDTRAQGAFFTSVKSLYESGVAFKVSVYPAVTRYGIDFSYGHDAVIVSLGEAPRKDNVAAYIDLLSKRRSVADGSTELLDQLLNNPEWIEVLMFCANANPRALLKLTAQIETQLGAKAARDMRFEDVRLAINTVMDKHLDNMVPGVIKDLDPRLMRASDLLLGEFRSRISEKPGPYESNRPRGYLAVTNSMQVPYLCQAAIKLLVAANVVIPEGPARLSKRETGTLYLLHPGFIFRDNVISAIIRGTLSASDWLTFFNGLSSRVHAEITKSADLWQEIMSEVSNEPASNCENGHPMAEARGRCDNCGAFAVVLSPVKILLDKDIDFLDLSDAIKERLRSHGFDTVRKLFEAKHAEIDAVEYIGEKRAAQIKNVVSAAVDEFVAG